MERYVRFGRAKRNGRDGIFDRDSRVRRYSIHGRDGKDGRVGRVGIVDRVDICSRGSRDGYVVPISILVW